MKLLFCPTCGDVRKLARTETACACGKASGRYLDDGWHAEINQDALLIGLNNHALGSALAADPLFNHDIAAWLMNSNPRVRRISG